MRVYPMDNDLEPSKPAWEVYKDAFAPQPSRPVRAWERAPVSAHVPRLQGQKIWKKAGLKTQKEEDKENFEEAQMELGREGTGARKRMRFHGGKENIGDATWKEDGLLTLGITDGAESVKAEAGTQIPLEGSDANALEWVPRKRTGANHVITPRKPTRQGKLEQAKVQAATGSQSPEKPRRRKSMRKSLRQSAIGLPTESTPEQGESMVFGSGMDFYAPGLEESSAAVDSATEALAESRSPHKTAKRQSMRKSFAPSAMRTLDELVPDQEISQTLQTQVSASILEVNVPVVEAVTNHVQAETKSPSKVSKRNSMRKSIRQLHNSTSDESTTAPKGSMILGSGNEVPSDAAEESVTAAESTTEDAHAEPYQKTAEEEQAEAALNDKLNGLFGFMSTETKPRSQTPEVAPVDEATRSSSPPVPEPAVKVPLNDLVHPESIEGDVNSDADLDDERESRRGQDSETQSVIISSIEAYDETEVSQPTKKTRTPKKKKKRETSQRRGTRRSTRTMRTSSVRPEEQVVTEVSEGQPDIEETAPQPSEVASGITQTPSEKMATGSEPAMEEDITTEDEPTRDIEQTQEITEAVSNDPVTVPVPETGAKSIHEEFDSFYVSEAPVSDHAAIDPAQTAGDEDFELLPLSSAAGAPLATFEESPEQGLSEIEAQEDISEGNSSPMIVSPEDNAVNDDVPVDAEDFTIENLETFEPVSMTSSGDMTHDDTMSPPLEEDLPETSTPDPTPSALVDTISENAPLTYEYDETDLLRNFVTRVKANKAAKASTGIPRRKRSLPHSPLRLPLGEANADISPSDTKTKDEFDVSLPGSSSSKRQKRSDPVSLEPDEDDTITERKATRRSGRTRLPVSKLPVGAPSHIPVRRLGQDPDATVTLRRNEDKELAALTRVNTRKNKGLALSVNDILAKKAEEKDDPVLRQRLLKEVFEDKASKKAKKEKRKTVVWAEELTQYQTVEGRKAEGEKEKEGEVQKATPAETKKGAVKVGIRSKIALGMAANGTPAPKRKRTPR